MSDVFISYAREDEAAARRLAKALQKEGRSVWWDAQLPAHLSYSDVIERNLSEAKTVVVLWSHASAGSQWVRAEADFARSQGKLVQARLDGVTPPLPFNQIQCAELNSWRGGQTHPGWRKLADSVAAILEQREPPVPADSSHARWLRPAALAAILAVMALIAGLMIYRPPGEGAETRRPVLAVLPFSSVDGRDQSLVRGIWEDTRHAIGRNPQLLVLGPNTAEELAERGMEATRRAADYVLEASIRSAGDRIRVNTSLVRTEDGAQLWSENFDRRLADVFSLQSEIAREIEGRIRGRLATGGGVQPQHIATSAEIYALYSDARAKIRNREFERYEEATAELHRVVSMDPNFAPGWATLAVAKRLGPGTPNAAQEAEAHARRAIALAPNLAAGHAALGFALGKGPAARAALRRAISLDPNDFEALNWLANSLDPGKVQERLRIYSRVVEIEPLWWPAVMNKVNTLREAGANAALVKELARIERLGDRRMATVLKIMIAEDRGDLSEAVATGLAFYREASAEDRQFVRHFLVSALFRIGLVDLGDKLFKPPNDYIPLIRTNDPRAIDMMEAQHSPPSFWTYGVLPVVAARVYLLNGQGPRLARMYHAAAASPAEFEALVGKEALPDIAPGVALALRSAGDADTAAKLLDRAEQAAAEDPTAPLDQLVRLARIHAVQGDTDRAMGELLQAVQHGWLPPFLPINTDIAWDPPLAQMKRDPRFERVRQHILAHVAKERAELGPVSLS